MLLLGTRRGKPPCLLVVERSGGTERSETTTARDHGLVSPKTSSKARWHAGQGIDTEVDAYGELGAEGDAYGEWRSTRAVRKGKLNEMKELR